MIVEPLAGALGAEVRGANLAHGERRRMRRLTVGAQIPL
jgi:hypothetical protein